VADTSAIYTALSSTLSGDATLMALMTDGVYRDVAPAGKTKVVIISKQADDREYGLDKLLAYEDVTYLVKAVEKSTSGTAARQAASRIRALLQDAAFSVSGYGLMRCHVSEDNGAVEYQEVDPDDTDARWQHRGWLFDVMVSPV
jgi:hypothetical protein